MSPCQKKWAFMIVEHIEMVEFEHIEIANGLSVPLTRTC